MKTKMQEWGSGHAARPPRASVRRASRGAYSLEQLVRRIRKANRHDEADFGAAQGREAWC